VFFDARSPEEFAKGSIAGAHNAPIEKLGVKAFDNLPLPNDDFNRRVILFGADGAQARALADVLTKRPWHNTAYYAGTFASLAEALKGK
jgi:rhodanese-related sulfurtransferase